MPGEAGRDDQLGPHQMSQQAACARSLVADVLSLDEPWRSRFVELMAERRNVVARRDAMPTQDQMVAWLCDDELYQEIRTLYRLWTHE